MKTKHQKIKPTPTREQVEQMLDLEQTMKEATLDENSDQSKENPGKVTTRRDPVPIGPFDDIRPHERVELSALTSAPNQVLKGSYLLCQTISTVAIFYDHFEVVVTDPKGVSVMPLALSNYHSVENPILHDLDEVLPPGSYLLLKNPLLGAKDDGSLIIKCDNPGEVEMISRKRMETKFQGLKWNSAIAKLSSRFCRKPLFWEILATNSIAFEKLEDLGHKGFEDGRISDSIRFYDMALDYCENREDEAMINANKSVALLSLGCKHAALKCAESALEVNPECKRYNFIKIKVLIELGKSGRAPRFMEEKFNQFSSLKEDENFKTLLERVKLLESRKGLGPTESQLLSIRMKTLDKNEYIPQFVGPVALNLSIGEGDRGRGLRASQDIRPGQLLICVKAFAYHSYQPEPQSSNDFPCNPPWGEIIVRQIANKLAFDPDLASKSNFYNLSGGEDMGHLETGDWRIRHVDMERIRAIVKINAFSSSRLIPWGSERERFTGLWIAPSFANHSCAEYNGMWATFGEWMTLIATTHIKEGDEVCIAYMSPIASFEARASLCKSLGFACSCKLCKLDGSESNSIRNERRKILEDLKELNYDCGPEELKKAMKGVRRLISFRREDVDLNYPLLSPQIFRLEDILFRKYEERKNYYQVCVWLLNEMFKVAAVSACWYFWGVKVAFANVLRHALLKDKEMTKRWVATVKRLVIKFFGSLEPMRTMKNLERAKQQFGIDFFQED